MLILLLGPPGCGKGTQSKRLIKHFNASYLGMGDIIRYEINSNTDIGIKMQKYICSGDLVPDKLISMVFKKTFEKQKSTSFHSTILDGFPRTITQANFLQYYFPKDEASMKILFFDVPNDLLMQRLLDRKRSDDTEEIINNRLDVYNSDTRPLLDFYDHRVKKVSGVGSEDHVFSNILSLL